MIAKTLQKAFLFFLPFLVFFFVLNLFSENLNISVFSNELEKKESELEGKKQEKKEALSQLEQVKKEIARIQNSGYSLDQQIRLINAELKRVDDETKKLIEDIEKREKNILEKEEDLKLKQEQVERISERLYKSSRISFLEILFRQGGENNFIQTLIFNRFVIDSQISYMRGVAEEMRELEEEKGELEKQKQSFEKDQKDFEESKSLLAKQKIKIQEDLNKQVAQRSNLTRRIGGLEREISELQNFLLLMRSGGTVVNADKLVSSNDGKGSLGNFKENAPTTSFGVFSFGAYTHRNGMSQWGAWARSRAGQSYEDILKFYYPGTKIETRDNLMGEITVTGFGKMSFEEKYLLGIREINGAWNTSEDMDILKAQAITARSYAVARTNNGGSSICATQACQVYSDTHHGGAWAKAVEETRGMVVTNSSGSVVSTQYAAVHGGWVNGVGFDVRSSGGSWIEESWDNISGVSWFYRNWYDKDGSTCSTHPSPWLTNAEMSDILNAYLYWSHPDVKSDSRLTAVDIATCWGKKDANPYSMGELKERLKETGGKPVDSISKVVTSNSNGSTTQITFVTNTGTVTVNNPSIFKEVYNMRAPAFFSIPQSSFLHINIEMK